MLLTYELLFQRPALVDGTSRRRGPEPAERQFPRQVRARTLGHRPTLHGKNKESAFVGFSMTAEVELKNVLDADDENSQHCTTMTELHLKRAL